MSDTEAEKVKAYILQIRSAYSIIRQTKEEAKRTYNATLESMNVQLEKLQARCPHIRTERHPDASGNNDSYDSCLDCGKEDKRL